MGSELVLGDDGLRVELVHEWVVEKHAYLREYVKLCDGPRGKTDRPAFIDPFASCGRSKIIETGAFVAGSPLVAWDESTHGKKRFDAVYVADVEEERRRACVARLRKAAAPAIDVPGNAIEAVTAILGQIKPEPLHLAFLDPHSLGQLDLKLIEQLATLPRIDLLIHVSVMDMQRNLLNPDGEIDRFAPGWQDRVSLSGSQADIRARLLEYWKGLVRAFKFEAFATDLFRGPNNARLYWLMLLTRNPLAEKLWRATVKATPAQKSLFGF